MILDLQNINYYYLTISESIDRQLNIKENFKGINLIEVNPVLNISRYQSGATGFLRMIDLALKTQDRTKII